jgi:hypothetical protein
VHEHPVLEPHAYGGGQHDVDLERPDQQRPHSPLVPIKKILRVCPCRQRRGKQPPDVLVEWEWVGRVEADPEAIAVVGRLVTAQDRHDEADKGGDQSREHEPWRAAEGAAGDRLERSGSVPLLVCELQRLVGAHEARQEGEDGHADAPLPWYPQVWQLQQSWGGIWSIGGPEQGEIEGSGDVSDDNEDGGDTSEALWETGVSVRTCEGRLWCVLQAAAWGSEAETDLNPFDVSLVRPCAHGVCPVAASDPVQLRPAKVQRRTMRYKYNGANGSRSVDRTGPAK